MLLEPSILCIGRREVALVGIGEAGQEAGVLDGDEGESPADENQRHEAADDEGEIGEEVVRGDSLQLLGAC